MKKYVKPVVLSEKFMETSALACGKTPVPPPGSRHWNTTYETFTGHLGIGFGTEQSVSGQGGVGFGPGSTSFSYGYSGLCTNWVTLAS